MSIIGGFGGASSRRDGTRRSAPRSAAAAFFQNLGEVGEVGIHQNDLSDLTAGFAALRHGNGAVRLAEREKIVDAVSGHGNLVTELLRADTRSSF